MALAFAMSRNGGSSREQMPSGKDRLLRLEEVTDFSETECKY